MEAAILIVTFISAYTPPSTSAGTTAPAFGVTMQEFSSMTTCEAARA